MMNLKKKIAQVGITKIFTIIGIMLMSLTMVWAVFPVLTDHTVYNETSNICSASNLSMNIDVYPCKVQDLDGKDIVQYVDFKWTGVSNRQTSWVFVYNGTLESGKLEVETIQNNIIIWIDHTSDISYLGTNLQGQNLSYYKVQNINFQPNQEIKTRWTYTPKNNQTTGKWSIFGYPSILSIQDAISNNKYIYLDPWWKNSHNNTETIEKLRNKTHQEDLRNKDKIRDFDKNLYKYKSYNASEKRLKIEDKDFNVLLDMKLESDYRFHVHVGNDTKIAEMLLYDWKNGTDLFDLVNLYDVKNNYKEENRTFIYKYGTDYIEERCWELESNMTFCENITKTNWTEFTLLSELNKNIKIGIFTNTNYNEKIEWVPTIQGFECLEWATWQSDSDIISGLTNIGSKSTPTVFQKDLTWYLISGDVNGVFTGFNWTGSTWQSDTAIISGLGDVGIYSAPYVFQKDLTWYLIAGNNDGTFNGFNWTGSTWQSDSDIISGLSDVGWTSSPSVFQKDSTWYLVSGDDSGTFNGFNWTGSTWQSDSAIISGLGDVGSRSRPTVFQKDSTWYLISGEFVGVFYGFNWTGSTWQSDSDIISGLSDVGDYSAPTIFQKDSTWYLITGNNGGTFNGFNVISADITPPTFTTIPANTTINYTQGFGVQFNATDETAFDTYAINWTTLFEINSTGYLKNSTNIAVGIYEINVTINDTSNNLNSTIYKVTVNQADSQTSLTFDVASPQDYGTSITPTCSVITGEGSAVLRQNGTIITSGVAITLGADTYSFNCSMAETQNYTSSENVSSYTINKATPTGSLTSDLGWIINESQSVTIALSETNTGDGDLTYIIYRDGVSKTTGETWSPAYGTYDYILNTTGGANYSTIANMDSQTLIVNDITNPQINFTNPTEDNNSYIAKNYTYVNVSTSDTNPGTSFIDWNNSLVGWWKFNNATDFIDHSTNSNNGTNYGSTYTTDGKFGGARNFDGSNDYIDIPTDSTLNITETFTIEAWVYPKATGSNMRIVWAEETYTLWIRNDNVFRFADTLGNNVITTMTATANTWYHVVGVFTGKSGDSLNSSNIFLYINGEQKGTTYEGAWNASNLNSFSIGKKNTQDYFNGTIDEVKIHNRVLCAKEINASYDVGTYRLSHNFTSLADGEYTYTAHAQDLAGNVNQTEARILTIDTTYPALNLIYPTDSLSISGSQDIPLNFSVSDTDLDTCWYNIKNSTGGYDTSNTTVNCSKNTTFSTTIYDTFNLTFYANDTANNINSSLITFTVTQPSGNLPPSQGSGGGSPKSTFNKTLICDYAEQFLREHIIKDGFNYSKEEIRELTDLINFYSSPNIQISTTELYLKNFENQCNRDNPTYSTYKELKNQTDWVSFIGYTSNCSHQINKSLDINFLLFDFSYNLDFSFPFFKIDLGYMTCDSLNFWRNIINIKQIGNEEYQMIGLKLWWIFSITFIYLIYRVIKRMTKENKKLNRLLKNA